MKSSVNRPPYCPRISRKVKRYSFLGLITVASIAVLIFIGKRNLVYSGIFKNGVFYFDETVYGGGADKYSHIMKSTRATAWSTPGGEDLADVRSNVQTRSPRYNTREMFDGDVKGGEFERELIVSKSKQIITQNNDNKDVVPNDEEVSTVRNMVKEDVSLKTEEVIANLDTSETDNRQNTGATDIVRKHIGSVGMHDSVGTNKMASDVTDDQTDIDGHPATGFKEEPVVAEQNQINIEDTDSKVKQIKYDVPNENARVDSTIDVQQDGSNTVAMKTVKKTKNAQAIQNTNAAKSKQETNNMQNTQHTQETGYTNGKQNKYGTKSMNGTQNQQGTQSGQKETYIYKEGHTPVLLLTYLRSGSTLTADIIQQVPRVFYAYEPLKPYLQSHTVKRPEDLGYFTLNGICSISNSSCRPPSQQSEETQMIIDEIVRFYSCDLNHFNRAFMWSRTGKSVAEYHVCIKTSARLKTRKEMCLKQCYDSAKSIKTIRLSMDIVEILMQKVANLKVVHLLRDPRGMIQSRKRGGFVKPWMNLTAVARSVCQRFERDIEIAMKLKQKYPGRLKTYLYEQIAEHPKESSESLFHFLGMVAPDNFNIWLYNHTAAGNRSSFYGTSRPNSTATATAWRLKLPYKEVTQIDNECSNYYKYTGILPATSSKTLTDLNFPLRSSSPLFEDSSDSFERYNLHV